MRVCTNPDFDKLKEKPKHRKHRRESREEEEEYSDVADSDDNTSCDRDDDVDYIDVEGYNDNTSCEGLYKSRLRKLKENQNIENIDVRAEKKKHTSVTSKTVMMERVAAVNCLRTKKKKKTTVTSKTRITIPVLEEMMMTIILT